MKCPTLQSIFEVLKIMGKQFTYSAVGNITGAHPVFSFRGAQKVIMPARTLRAWKRTHFRQGSRARLRALEALGLF